MKVHKTKKLNLWLITAITLLVLIPALALAASATDGAACTTDDCTGTYTNGFCSADSTHYEAAQQVSETHHPS